jgi:hypothetical protein
LTSVYYAAYRAGWLWTAGGRRIAPMGRGPIAPSQADLVYNARITRASAWVWDVALDPRTGRPVIVYATFPSAQHHDYWYAERTATRWVSHFLTGAGGTIAPDTMEFEYSGGITLDHADPSIVHLSRDVRGGYEIERWTTDDGGTSWHHTVVVPPGIDLIGPWSQPRGTTGRTLFAELGRVLQPAQPHPRPRAVGGNAWRPSGPNGIECSFGRPDRREGNWRRWRSTSSS